MLAATGTFAQSTPDNGNCRYATVDFGQGPQRAMYCQGPDGTWREQQAPRDRHSEDSGATNDGPPGGSPPGDGPPGGGSPPPSAYAPPSPAYTPPAPAYTPPPPPVQVVHTRTDRVLDHIVQADAASWHYNRYDSGSMVNSKIVARSRNTVTIYGEYTYNGGAQGWVRAMVSRNGRVKCLSFWDDQPCRPLGQSLSARFDAEMARHPGNGGGGQNGGTRSYDDPFGFGSSPCPWYESDQGFGRCS
jgi:hypothetical protein